MKIFLDNAATTRPYDDVAGMMSEMQKSMYGNPSSVHQFGVKAATKIEQARILISGTIGCTSDDIFFNSGGTEANNTALKGVAFANSHKGRHIIISPIEHPSVYAVAKWLETHDFKISILPVDSQGFVNPDDVAAAIRKDTILISVMQANNEIGTIEPIEEIGKICSERNVLFHTDACQSYTKTDLNGDYADLITLNAHKIHGPKGVGALYVRQGTKIDALLHGGGQESDFRGGTYNAPAIAGFGMAAIKGTPADIEKMRRMNNSFINRTISELEGAVINGPVGEKRLCNNINLMVDGIPGKKLFLELDKRGIAVSTGSACSNAATTPSRILLAIGLRPEIANQALRISLSKFTTEEELDITFECLKEIVEEYRNAQAKQCA